MSGFTPIAQPLLVENMAFGRQDRSTGSVGEQGVSFSSLRPPSMKAIGRFGFAWDTWPKTKNVESWVEIRLGLRPERSKTSEGGVLALKSTSVGKWATFGADLIIDEAGKVQVLGAWAVDRNGKRQAMDVQWFGTPWGAYAMQGLVMTVEPAKFKDGVDRELWLEVAMLATSLAEDDSVRHSFNSTLDLDWLFGADPLSSDTAASEDTLRGLHEVQARIISVSPPISING